MQEEAQKHDLYFGVSYTSQSCFVAKIGLVTFPKQQHHRPGSLDDALQRGTTVMVAPPPPDDDHLGLCRPHGAQNAMLFILTQLIHHHP